MFLESQRRHVRKIAEAINDGELNVWIIFRNQFDNRSLGKPNADDEIVVAFSKRAHRRLDRSGITGLDIAQHNRQRRLAATRPVGPLASFRALRAGPGRGVE